jgi:hypothetical protein
VHIVMFILDSLSIVIAFVLCSLLNWKRRIPCYLGAALSIGVALRYHRGYSWVFLAQWVISAGIPIVMAWAGNHLAAKGETTEERIFWRVLFYCLTIVALVGSFLVMNQERVDKQIDKDEARRQNKEECRDAITEYNKNNPQHALTPAQIEGLMKSDEKSRVPEYLSGMSDSYLATMAQTLGVKLEMARSNLLTEEARLDGAKALATTQEARDKVLSEAIRARAQCDRDIATSMRDGDVARKAILQRLKEYPPQSDEDRAEDVVFSTFSQEKIGQFDNTKHGYYLVQLSRKLVP